MSLPQADLFGRLPEGFEYRRDFISAAEETVLLEEIGRLEFKEAKHREYTARRRIVVWEPQVPEFLHPLRAKAAQWARLPDVEFRQALINEYRAGTPLGWHRDSPDYGVVVGVSLAAACAMRLRPYPPRRGRNPDALTLELERRSGYVFRGPVRWDWQHAIPATKALRYSITLRTLAQ